MGRPTKPTTITAGDLCGDFRVLPREDRRWRDLGLFNLTNTLPSLIMPRFALILVPYFGFSGLFVLLAILPVITGFLLAPLARHT